MSLRLLLVALLPSIVASVARAQESPLSAARNLLGGKPAEALAATLKLRKDLPPNARLFRWRHSWEKQTHALHALLGRKHVYFVLYKSRHDKLPLGLKDVGPPLNGTNTTYDFNEVVVCVEASSGKVLWTRQTAGHTTLVLDPQTDDLFSWRDYRPYQTPHLFRVEARTGKLLLDKRLPQTKERMEGLVLAGLPFASGMWGFSRENAKEVNLYNLAKDQFESVDYRLPRQISPNEKHRLKTDNKFGVPHLRTIELRALDGKSFVWKYEHPSYSPNEPFWLEDEVVAMNGEPDGRAEIVRLKGETGAVVWRYPLPLGAYSSRQIASNHYRHLREDWTAIHASGKHLLALGGDATILFLNPKTGERVGSLKPGDDYLVCPRVVGDCLVYATTKEVAAVPLDLVFAKPGAVDERHAIVLQAQCLAKLERASEGVEELRRLLRVFPDFVEGWTVKADLCRAAGLKMEEAEARCRRLEVTAKDHDPVLEKEYGLLKRLATGQKINSTIVGGNQIYATTLAGFLYEFDLGALEFAGKTNLAVESHPQMLRIEFLLGAEKKRVLPDEEVLKKAISPWRGLNGRAGKVVRYKGQYVRPVGGGGVRIVSRDGTVSTFKTRLREIERWELYIGPGGPLGYGDGGVYTLDANLAPQSHRVQLGRGRLNKRLFSVWTIASDGKTLALVTNDDKDDCVMQIWSHDGKTKLREAEILPARFPPYSEAPRLHALRGGYLFVGSEVTWVPTDAKQPVRRFALEHTRPAQALRRMDPTTMAFQPPLVTPTRLLVPGADGAIYVFDLEALTKRQ